MTPPAESLRRLGGFEIERELGRGGMGVVYLARDPRLERRVALKALPEDLALDPDRLGQFQREARVLAALNHPNIATLHGMEDDGRGSRFLVMEWVDGVTLRERLEAGALPLPAWLDVMAQIAHAVAAAHAAGIVHRDLKPGNVMVLAGGRIKVLDFGLARRVHARATTGESAAGLDSVLSGIDTSRGLVGTAGYLSPERVMGEAEDARTDLFSFGCVAYECLTGAAAFRGDSVLGILTRIVKEAPDWSRLPPDTPVEVRTLLAACLDKRPESRPAGFDAVARTLDRIRERRRAAPAPASSDKPNNLPRRATSFVGRDRDLSECLRRLDAARLVSITGPGGCGKTRLALRVAELALEGAWSAAWFVELASLTDAERVVEALAAALGVRLMGDAQAMAAVVERLDADRPLLVIDNCEHVLDAVRAVVATLLERCQGLGVVATSRQELGVTGESAYPVPPFPVPPAEAGADAPAALAYESVRLFTERASDADRGFVVTPLNAAAVVAICRGVDGIPLAIELAAARVRVLAPAEIAARLDQQLRLLRSDRGGDPRHATVTATIGWSVELLDPNERRAFRALSVFAGGWTLEAAAAVLGDGDDLDALDQVGGLVGRSLAVTERDGDTSRYRYLEPVRQFARQALADAGEHDAAHRPHYEHFRAFVARAAEGLKGRQQGEWVERLEREHDNVLAAIEWCGRAPDRAPAAQELAASLLKFWVMHGHARTGRATLARVLALDGGAAATAARGHALYALGGLNAFDTDGSRLAEPPFAEAYAIFEALGMKHELARASVALAATASRRDDHARALELLERAEAYFKETGDRMGQSATLANLAAGAWRRDDLPGARRHFEAALELLRDLGELTNLAQAAVGLAFVTTRLGDPDAGRAALREALDAAGRLGGRSAHAAGSLLAAGELAVAHQRFEDAARWFGAADQVLESIGLKMDETDAWWRQRPASEASVRAALGNERCDWALAQGRALPGPDAVARAAAEL